MRLPSLLSAASVLALAMPAAAQEASAPAADTAAEETILVTGSRIPRPEFEGNIPGAQITAQDIQARGFTNVLDALNDLPLVGPGASPIGNAGGQPASLGAAFVDLLDLGTNRTLSLVNGRRFVSGNAGTLFVAGNVTGGQVDLNVIPTELVERTDVLTVGGAVAYGSDAIAGVVNIILKDDYDGIAVTARSGITTRGDAANYQIGGIVGRNFADDRANITIAFEYNRDDGLQGNAREEFSANYVAPTFFGNGGVRNSAFAPAIPIDVTGANNGAFLRATDDGQPGNRFLPLVVGGSILLSEGGTVFQYTGARASLPTTFSAVVAGTQVGALQSLAGNTQAVSGVGVSAAASALLGGNAPAVGNPATLPPNTFTRFAPSTLPAGATAAHVAGQDLLES
jgi:outer membrane receptor protein involved in Fe transport